MLDRRAATRLLADAGDRAGLVALVAACGFDHRPLRLDAGARAALGLPSALRRARVVEGPGALRALVAEVAAGTTAREAIARTARRLSTRAPAMLWLLAVCEQGAHGVAIATWRATTAAPRVLALAADRRRIVDSDAETLASLAAARETGDAGDLLTYERWCELLGRDALTRRFYRTLERLVALLAADVAPRTGGEDARTLALLCVTRLLFLAFLEAKGWLDGDRDFLSRHFARCSAAGGGFHARVLVPLWFGTLNTPARHRAPAARSLGEIPFLNGGLFAPAPVERRRPRARFSDAALGQLFDELLARYRFTAREDGAGWSEAAVDPEMLGRAFESLMAATDRRAGGAFYTPQAVVETVATEALVHALAGEHGDVAAVRETLAGGIVPRAVAAPLRARAASLRVLDPSCGSGAFLVHVLERVADLLRRCGDARPVSAIRREVLARGIFGVDVDATAVWLCELRLWLSVVIDDAAALHEVPPLPNLDHHVRPGDALAGPAFDDAAPRMRGAHRLAALRERYVRASGRRKLSLARALDHAERSVAVATLDREIACLVARRRDALAAARGRDLFGDRHPTTRAERAARLEARAALADARARRRALLAGAPLPFGFPTHFADAAAAGGFDVVVGNPPWVRPHRMPPAARRALRQRFVVARDAAWRAGAAAAGAERGFGGQADLAALFTERALALTRPGGVLALLLPSKLWCALAGGGVRAHVAAHARLLALEDWSAAPAMFDAATYPSLLVASRRDRVAEATGDRATDATIAVAHHRRGGVQRWRVAQGALPLVPGDPASPWLALPADVRAAFDAIADAGTPLAARAGGRPLLGVKSGCNEAFLVTVERECGAVARVRAGSRTGEVERALLRPALRGAAIAPWRAHADGTFVLWTHDTRGAPLAALPPGALRWLLPHRARLAARSDGGSGAWWALFRPEAARSDRPRVVWADIGRAPRAAVLDAGDDAVPLNSCYVAPCDDLADALALAALLQGPLAAAWLAMVAEPARGGYRRYLGWTVARLPLPRDWARARGILAPIGDRARRGDVPSPQLLLEAALEAYALHARDVAPLVEWADP